jgi:hypothetical protein
MPPVPQVARAQARRDAALRGVSRITWWVAGGAVALTAALSALAAASGDQSGVSAGDDGGATLPGPPTAPASVGPADGGPVAVSGGS